MSKITIGTETLDQYQIKKRLSENGMYLQFIDNATYDDCLKAVKENHMAFQFVESKFQTLEICKLALQDTNFQMLKFIKRLDDPAIFDLVITITPKRLLRQLFSEFIDPSEEMCCAFVQKDPMNIYELPKDKRVGKVCDVIIDRLDEQPELIKAIPNFTSGQLAKAVKVNRTSIQYIDFNRYRIIELYDDDTEKFYTVTPDRMELERIESYVLKTNDTSLENKSEPEMYVYYENLKDSTTHLIKDSKDIIDEIHKYIKLRYGNKNMEYIKKMLEKGLTVSDVENDQIFAEGIFYQKLENGKYELYKKSTVVDDESWLFGTKKINRPVIEKIRVYSLIRV